MIALKVKNEYTENRQQVSLILSSSRRLYPTNIRKEIRKARRKMIYIILSAHESSVNCSALALKYMRL